MHCHTHNTKPLYTFAAYTKVNALTKQPDFLYFKCFILTLLKAHTHTHPPIAIPSTLYQRIPNGLFSLQIFILLKMVFRGAPMCNEMWKLSERSDGKGRGTTEWEKEKEHWTNTTSNAPCSGKPNPLKIEFPFYIRSDLFSRFSCFFHSLLSLYCCCSSSFHRLACSPATHIWLGNMHRHKPIHTQSHYHSLAKWQPVRAKKHTHKVVSPIFSAFYFERRDFSRFGMKRVCRPRVRYVVDVCLFFSSSKCSLHNVVHSFIRLFGLNAALKLPLSGERMVSDYLPRSACVHDFHESGKNPFENLIWCIWSHLSKIFIYYRTAIHTHIHTRCSDGSSSNHYTKRTILTPNASTASLCSCT